MSSTITPATQIVDSGETATFNCTVQGNPIQVVEWYKDGHLLVDDDRIIYQSDTLLHIDDVQRKDQGMYQCFISDGDEEVQGTSQLLLGGIYFLIGPSQVNMARKYQNRRSHTNKCEFSLIDMITNTKFSNCHVF